MVAHDDGLNELKRGYPELRLCAVEILDNKYNLFTDNSLWFQDKDNTNSPLSAFEFYDSLVKDKRLSLPAILQTGYGNLAIAYGFQHGTPDNCLPILWKHTNNWKPLLER